MKGSATHKDWLDEIIKTLIYKGAVSSDSDLYKAINVDNSTASLVRTGKRKLPKKAKQLLCNIYDVRADYLNQGELPMFSEGVDSPVILDQKEIDFLKAKIHKQEIIINELRQILKDGVRLSKEDLKNKGVLGE